MMQRDPDLIDPVRFEALDLLGTPVWIVLPAGQRIVFANQPARALTGEMRLQSLRSGPFSSHAEPDLMACLAALADGAPVFEVLTVERAGRLAPLRCRLRAADLGLPGTAVVFEGLFGATDDDPLALERACPADHCREDGRGFYDRLFNTNTAPMLLIDPADEGRIVDANLAATRFYGYSRQEMWLKHVWDINALGRDVLPHMHDVAKLPGGYGPRNFVHVLADGSQRHVQTYAGPLVLDGKRLMLCIIHDITEQRRLEQELAHAAQRDPLTGLWNRRQLLHLVDRAHAQSLRYGQTYSLMLIDVDHFKSINDVHGHLMGDEVLVLLARTLEARVRETDAVCRWGGEEFVVLLPQTQLEGAVNLAESLRQTIDASLRSGFPQITVSIGLAEHRDGEDAALLFKHADEALYRAKLTGRNRVVAHDGSA